VNWHIPVLDAVLVVLFVAGILLGIAVTLFNHLVFAGYLRRAHPEVYRTLTGEEARRRTGRLTSDSTEDMRRFRTRGDDLGDPQVARLRRVSLGATKAAVGCFVAIGATIVIYVGLTVSRPR
jgi:hypothetical protein